MYRQRLMKEAKEASKKPFDDFLLICDPSDLLKWKVFVKGPSGTPYQGYIYLAKITLTTDYPTAPPAIAFETKVVHPNVHLVTGQVCMDLLKNQWRPTCTLQAVSRMLICLLEEPNADSPLNCDAAILLRQKETDAYRMLVHAVSQQHAIKIKDFEAKLGERVYAE